MSKVIDLTGQKFGRLTVIERAENAKDGRVQWLCRCECGKKVVVRGVCLLSGHTQSCGCLHKENFNSRTHGRRYDKNYKVWLSIKQRCFNPNNPAYELYGARGISLYDLWVDAPAAFIDYVSKLEHFEEKGYSLDRIDNSKDYEPGNLRYATDTEQARNRRTNVIVEYEGEKMALSEASEKSGINYGTLKSRYHAGDRGERLFRPVRKHK